LGYIGTAYNSPVAKWVRIWSELGGDPGIDADVEGISIAQEQNDNYVVQMVNRVGDNNNESYVVYFTKDGNYRWEKLIETKTFSSWKDAHGRIIINSDDDIVTLSTLSTEGLDDEDCNIIKSKIKNGTQIWNTDASDVIKDMAELGNDEGYATVGCQTDAFPQNQYSYKYNESGIKVNWGNGNANLVACTGSFDGVCVDDDDDIYLLDNDELYKFDGTPGATEGDQIWKVSITSSLKICQGHDGSICAIGRTYILDNRAAFDGARNWLTSAISDDAVARSISPTDDGGYIACGYHSVNNTMLLVKYSSTGGIDWKKEFVERDGWTAKGSFAIQTMDGGYLAVGTSCPPNNYDRAYIIKTNQYGETCSKGEPCE